MVGEVGEGYSEENVLQWGFEGHQLQRVKKKRCFPGNICPPFKILLFTDTLTHDISNTCFCSVRTVF